ncbi:hypothetical protein JKF63_06116 [Porcisia hertigi]|uniref:Uncharacterized protein n=1 Tax=Porcisia hertigi TaxID=2761500 RepID=A0A836LFY8_9TRYP|nr:hypothetical protein JKF63_06116 [Porcisia hertigi]
MVFSASPPRQPRERLMRAPTRATAAADAFITSVSMHPIEPIQVMGLSSGEVCLYAAKTDTLSWLIEMDVARKAYLRQGNAAMPSCSTTNGVANAGRAGAPLATLAPPENPFKVFSFSSEHAGCSIAHCGFLRGRNEDLLREVVQRLQQQPSSSSLTAQHLLYVITSANDLYLVDVKTDVILVQWAGGNSASGRSNSPSASPLSPHFMVTQVETYGALMYLTVACRDAVKAATEAMTSQRYHHLQESAGSGPERNMYQRCNEPAVYVIHLGYTNPLAASTTKALMVGGGAYVIKAMSRGRSHPTSNHTGGTAGAAEALSIRAHPFAPLLLLLLNRSEVQVFAINGDGEKTTPPKAQLILLSAATAPSSDSGGSLAPPPRSQCQPQPVIDAQFVPSAAVLVPRHGAGHTLSRFSSSKRKWVFHNVQILLVTPTRLRLLCTRAVAATAGMSGAEANGVIAADRAFYAVPSSYGTTSSSTSTAPNVTFLRAWTWLGSPDNFFVLQSNRVLVELSCNDLIAASMDVPSVRSRRLLPPRTDSQVTNGKVVEDASGTPGIENWWLIPSSPAVYRPGGSITAAGGGGGVAGLSCVQWPDVLPLWGRGALLNAVFAPRLPVNHSEDSHTLIFSRLTGLTRPLPIQGPAAANGEKVEAKADAEDDTAAGSEVFHLSLLADTDTISSGCICVRLCLTPQSSPAPTFNATTSGLSPHPVQDSVNVNVARLLSDSAAPALCRLEHGFYFLGSRAESAYADYPFLIAGLLYLDSVVEEAADGESPGRTRAPLRAAVVCLPSDKNALRQLYELGRRHSDNGGRGSWAEAAVAPTSEMKRALLQAVQHTQIQPLPVPQFDFEVCPSSSATPSKQLLDCAFQLSNDGVVPCVWSLWAPLSEAAPPPPKSTDTALSPRPEAIQLTMQRYYVAADTQELRWRSPELVQMDDPSTANPSQVFALSSVLTETMTGSTSSPCKSVEEDVLLDVDPAVVAQLFLYYADRKVLVFATIETTNSSSNSSSSSSRMDGLMDDTYQFASRTRNSRVREDERTTGGQGGAAGGSRQHLRLVPYAAAAMDGWKADNTAESLSCSLLTPVQLSAVMIIDHGDPAVQVAVVSRCFGVAVATFPLVGRRGVARVSASLLPVNVHLYRRWDELLCVSSMAADTLAGDGAARRRDASTTGAGAPTSLRRKGSAARTASGATSLGFEDAHHSTSRYASVSRALWVWPPVWPGEYEIKEGMHAAATSPVLLLQRGGTLYLVHVSGAAVQLCTSLLHCPLLQVVPPASATTTTGGKGELHLQYGSHLSLVARSRLLRQLQLQYAQYNSSAIYPQAATASNAKWFKKLVQQVQSSNAARLRLKARPQYMEWLQRVYAPASCELAYESPSSSGSETSREMRAVLERLTGAGVTHVGNMVKVNVTDLIRQATLVVEALAVSRCVQQLVSATGTLTASVRQSLQHITAVLGRDCTGGDTVTEPRILQCGWAVAEALAELPLACVTRALVQEALLLLRVAGKNGAPNSSQRSRAAVAQRWWWLVVRSSLLVSAVNGAQADEAQRELKRALDALPVNSETLQLMPMAAGGAPASMLCGEDHIETEAVSTVARALLHCSPQLMPHSVTQLLQLSPESNAPPLSQQQQQQPQLMQRRRLRAAVVVALETLGGCSSHVAAHETSPLPSLFSTVRIDGNNWRHAVYYTNLLGHLRHLASQETAVNQTSLREVASQCVQSTDPAVERVAVAVLEVAAQTVSVLLGSAVDVSEELRSRMATAMSHSDGNRLQRSDGSVLWSNRPSDQLSQRHPARALGGASDGGAQASDELPLMKSVYLPEHSPVDHLWQRLCAAQWQDLYGTFAYPSCYFFRPVGEDSSAKPPKSSAVAAAASHYTTADLPYQLWYHSHMAAPIQHTQASHANSKATSAAPGGSVFTNRRGGVKAVFLTEQPVTNSDAAVPSPVMEVVPVPSTPMSLLQRGEPQPLQLSFRATVAEEEATLHKTYFAAFARTDDLDSKAGSPHPKSSSNITGHDLHNDSLLHQLQARLNTKEAGESVIPSTTRRRKQQEEDRQRVPGPSAFAPSAMRRAAGSQGDAADTGIIIGGSDSTGAVAASTALYGTMPTQEEFFTRFASDD